MKKLSYFCLFLIIFGLETKIYAQLSPLATGLQKYRQGDLEGAITDFETALSQDRENERIQSYLFNCYLALGVRYAEEQNYNKAIDYLDRAQKLNPSDQEVKDLYQGVKAKVAPPTPPKPVEIPKPPLAPTRVPAVPPQAPAAVTQPPAVVPQPPAVVPQPPVKKEEVAPPVKKEGIPPPAPAIKEVVPVVPQPPVKKEEVKPPAIKEVKPPTPKVEKPVVEKAKEKKVTKPVVVEVKPTPTPPAELRKEIVRDELEKKLELMLVRIDRDRDELLKHLASWEEKERKERQRVIQESQKFMQRTILIVGVGLLFLTFFILGPIYSNVKQTTKEKNKIFREYEERITKMIEEHKQSLADFIALQTQPKIEETEPRKETAEPEREFMPPEPLISPEEIIEGATPELRLRAISIIEKELNYNNETEKVVALRLLEPFLNDKNKKVQLQAAETLDKYTPEKTANFWRNLISEGDKKILPEMMRNLTNLPPIGRAEILISFLNHPDYQIKKEILLNLQQLLKTKKDELPPAVIDRIKEIVEKNTIGKREAEK
ncbi:MAG TPA: hypothetical protein DHV62_07855 [Elusimicrobia bacterium]|jgi:tetratricopeptide (TPR) repeat protein|nr:hypothetical protein [Elusimicrobiota bacterium]